MNTEISTIRRPEEILGEAALVAKSVDALVRRRSDLVQVIGGRKHPRFELLQIVGQMFRVTPRIRETRRLSDPDGWEAVAEVVHVPTGQVVAVGEGMCTRDEPQWDVRPKYEWRQGPRGRERVRVGDEPVTSHQRRSMAQTRACSKALRLALGWVLGMAGYEATAAEEMAAEDDAAPAPAPAPQPQVRRKSARQATEPPAPPPVPEDADQDRLITTEEQRLLWAAARGRGLSDDDMAAILRKHGYERTADIRHSSLNSVFETVSKAAPKSDDFDLRPEAL